MSRKLFYMYYKSDLFQICSIPEVPVLQVRQVLQMDPFRPKYTKEKKTLNEYLAPGYMQENRSFKQSSAYLTVKTDNY